MQMDNRLPNLVNLSEDPQLSEILLYVIKEGATTVGKDKPDSRHDIRLSGVLIAEHHWYAAPLGLPRRYPCSLEEALRAWRPGTQACPGFCDMGTVS